MLPIDLCATLKQSEKELSGKLTFWQHKLKTTINPVERAQIQLVIDDLNSEIDGIRSQILENGCTGVTHPVLPLVTDESPNIFVNGTITAGPCTSGVIIGLAGDESALYAVSLNAGVWKSSSGSRWVQLSRGPERAYCIALSQQDPTHLAVGERDGDAIDNRLNKCGLWESYDAGNTWTYTLNPISYGARSQAVGAVAFSPAGTLFAGTSVGLCRKPKGGTWNLMTGQDRPSEFVLAIAVSESKIWVRTDDGSGNHKLWASSDDGNKQWTKYDIPTTLNDGLQVDFDYSTPGGSDRVTLAAFDNQAFIVVAPQSADVPSRALMILDVATNTWSAQGVVYKDPKNPQPYGADGRGLGGTRFVKAYVLNCNLPRVIGQGLQLFFGWGQKVHQATGFDGTTFQWDYPVDTDYARSPDDKSTPLPIHGDVWTFHVPLSYCPPGQATAWLAGDGGVYKAVVPVPNPAGFQGRASEMTWVTQLDGLHTHHVHTITVLNTSPSSTSKVAYVTSDNDAWFRDAGKIGSLAPIWQYTDLGDVNWSTGDVGNPAMAVVVLHPNNGAARLIGFNTKLPSGTPVQPISLQGETKFDWPEFFQLIQTLHNEPAYPLLHAVMLAQLPLTFVGSNGKMVAVPGVLGQSTASGRPWLIRNNAFANNPDWNTYWQAVVAGKVQGDQWFPEANDLPTGAIGFCASGGHTDTVYYCYAPDPTTKQLNLWRRPSAVEGWTRIFNGLQAAESTYGPAFVNPFNPSQIFVSGPGGVWSSSIDGAGNLTFSFEAVLTSLLTGSGKYSFTGAFEPGTPLRALGNRSRSVTTATLAHLAFNRNSPNQFAAVSPFTGIFYNGDGNWRDVGHYLPTPRTPIVSIALNDEAIYAATEGRGIFSVKKYALALLASYFTKSQVGTARVVLILHDSSTAPIVGGTVAVEVIRPTGDMVFSQNVKTDGNGQIILAPQASAGDIVHVRFTGNSYAAPCDTSLIL
jgi:hypothetical protein